MNAIRTARERARDEVRAEILGTARRHLAEQGAAGLSLRAVARELGMVPSAVYRYFDDRDALLTALIVEAYDQLGELAEDALRRAPRRRPARRWTAIARAVRQWAMANPHQYALLYGSPVPGYAAPEDTVVPGTRVSLALMRVVVEAHEDGLLDRSDETEVPMSVATRRDLAGLTAATGIDAPPEALFRALQAWTQLFGLVSFEVFGQTKGLVTNGESFTADATLAQARYIGLADEA